MNQTTTTVSYIINGYWDQYGDPRVKDLWLMQNGPLMLFAILASYLLFVLKVGPQLMKGKEPYSIRWSVFFYDIIMVVVNVYFFYDILWTSNYFLRFLDFKFPDRHDNSPLELHIVYTGWLYMISKFIDLFDTCFMVFRKKKDHISLLHLYHHVSVPMWVWLTLKLSPTAFPLAKFGALNCPVHIVMYSYYALASLGPKVQKHLWWKKYITQLQLLQFVILAMYAVVFCTFQDGYPDIYLYFGFSQPVILFFLFWDFYRKSYDRSTICMAQGVNNNSVKKNKEN